MAEKESEQVTYKALLDLAMAGKIQVRSPIPTTTRYFAVTVRLPRNPDHNPMNKKAGACPVNGQPCDDVTGQHHTFLCTGDDLSTTESIRKTYEGLYHVTRVEKLVTP
jgi:hypothetical protein